MSSSKDLAAYLLTRFPVTRFVPLAVFLSAAGLAQSPPVHLSPWVVATVQSLLLILLFRLWDDIADLDHDRGTHPERVLCNTQNIKSFLTLTGILFVFNGLVLIWFHPSYFKPIAYLVLCVYLLSWYRFRPLTSPPTLLNSHLVILKYPVIAWLISPAAGNSDWVLLFSCLFSVYLVILVFEILDDRNLHKLQGAKFILITNFSLLICVWALIALLNSSYTSLAFGAVWVIIVSSTLALGISGLVNLKKRSVTHNGYGFFIVGLLAYIALALEKSL